ncbi:A-kinase anchor protein 9 isoform X2 [Rhinatrema bivittatum]|uniref:A-kinase anchor protein 9 isoform X2 n=1 Tax=Rhinatrema bivittatum TaxID=194408 RepID=UPI00112EC152|nr:A-kinase anchor protein 9 isoform X2 [Rhinatrema bivittatum]
MNVSAPLRSGEAAAAGAAAGEATGWGRRAALTAAGGERVTPCAFSRAGAMEDEERQKKLEAGKAKLAQFRQRKADGQNPPKRQKKKKKSKTKEGELSKDGPDIDQSEHDETCSQDVERGAVATTKFTTMRTLHSGDIIKHDQTFTIEAESEISTTADDYSSEVNGCSFETRAQMSTNLMREEEFGVPENYSEHDMQSSQTRLEVMEDELVEKRQEIEELNRELEEMRAAYGTEGLQQLQEFEAAIKQRDGIITQLTANLQQARKEKDEIMREFLELTEQSQKLKIQFQHLQASETLRNTSHTSTAADLLLAKQQIITYQQQLEEQEHQLKISQNQIEEFQAQAIFLQQRTGSYEMVQQTNKTEESNEQKIQEKDEVIERLKTSLAEKEKNAFQLQEKILAADKSLEELKEQIIQKNQEANSLTIELTNSKQKERQSSDEIKQLMGTVEDLQKRYHKDSQTETHIIQRMELEAQKKLEQLRAELDEMYGQQIVQMKQELIKQHTSEIHKLWDQHKEELERTSVQSGIFTEEQINLMNMTISELNVKLENTNHQRNKIEQELSQQLDAISTEKSLLHKQVNDLLQDLSFAREQIERAKQSIIEKECKLAEANKFQIIIEDLKTQAVSASEFTKELELKHDAEITNYKIKLEMLEREKDEVLDRMAESQEAELERLRTQLLFSHEEELSKLREDLEQEHRANTEKLKGNLTLQSKQQLDDIQNEMSQKIEAMQCEKDSLITKQNQLMLEISQLNNLQQSIVNSKSEAMTLQISELQKEIETLRKEEKEKGTLEQEAQELQLKVDLLQKEIKDKEDNFSGKFVVLKEENKVLKDENTALHEKLKNYDVTHHNLTCIESDSRSQYLDLQKQVEIISVESEQLRMQNIQLKEEIERQKNTFSFAEKNFEVNFQELQEEYTCLLKVKAELEEGRDKQELEYESKLKTLNEELQFLRTNKHALFEMKSTVLEDHKDTFDAFESGEVVEKDTTELMEKLEVAQREKLELTLRLLDLSEQLKLKQNEINQLNEEIKSLMEDKEHVLVKCKELEMMMHCNQSEYVTAFEQEKEMTLGEVFPVFNKKSFDCKEEFRREAKLQSPFSNSDQHETIESHDLQQENLDLIEENQSLLDRLHELTSKLAGESLLIVRIQSENHELRKHLELLQLEQSDLRLQMEAQRISLTQVYSVHLELVREHVQKEKENELCSLRVELVTTQEKEMQELQKLYQQEILDLKRQQADDEAKSSQKLIEKLRKTVSEECSWLSQFLFSAVGEKCIATVKCETVGDQKETSNTAADKRADCDTDVNIHIMEAQVLQTNMQTLMDNIIEEYNRLMALHTQLTTDFKKIENLQTLYTELEHRKEEDTTNLRMQIESSRACSQDLIDLKEQLKIRSSCLEEIEKQKMEFSRQRGQLEEQHAQDVEHIRSYFQQQLKETEERYTTEIIHLQERLQDVSEPALQFRRLAESLVSSDQEKTESPDNIYTSSEDVLELDEMKLVEAGPVKSQSGPIQQLQTLRQVLHTKYTEEVNALKKQHSEELEQLIANLKELHSLENAALREEIVQLTKYKQENLNGAFRTASLLLAGDLEEKEHMDIVQLLEKRYQEKVEEEIAKVIVELSVAFAQQTELARIARQKENVDDGKKCGKNEQDQKNIEDKNITGQNTLLEKVLKKKRDKHVSTEQQPSEPGCVEQLVEQAVFQSNEPHPEQLLSHSDQDLMSSVESFSKDKFILNNTVCNKLMVSSSETSGLQMLCEQRVEDMRQELVKLDQEHQQATEALRQAHMLQMERQREDQEQLLAELDRLKFQLAKSALVVSENLATEREKMLLEEIEALKETSAMSDKKLCFELQTRSTQTQDENESRDESEEHTVKEAAETANERPKETSVVLIKERQSLQKAYNRLLKMLLEVAKTTVAVEETIGCHVLGLLDKSTTKDQPSSRVIVWNREPEEPAKPCTLDGTSTEDPSDSYHGSDVSGDDISTWSGGTDEGLELSQRLIDLAGIEKDPENEDVVLNISTRLQAAVEKLLETISETSNQLEHAKATQTELIRESIKRKQEVSELIKCQEELQERLIEETRTREDLALELSRAEGLLDGYTDEKILLEKQMQEKTNLIHHLEQELQSTGNRLQELEDERQQIQDERELLSRQKDAMKADAGSAELKLLEETEKLMKEKIEVQRQAEKEHDYLQKQVKGLEADLEEQVNSYIELEQERNAELEDVRQQNQALEKQLDKMRKFLDEQAVDREHERDVFQQEIQKLEKQLKTPQRLQPTNEHQTKEVEQLTNYLKEKTDKCSELLLAQEQLHRDVQEHNEEIEKLESRIRELEQALIISADDLQKAEERELHSAFDVKEELPLEAQLRVEREAIDRKEKEITNLEEQLEQFREELVNKNEEVQQLHMQLEIQRKESTTRLQELEQENKIFKDDMENLLQTVQEPEDSILKDRHLVPGKFAQIMQEKEQEIDQLNEQVLKLQQQLELVIDNKVEEQNDLIRELEAQTEYLRSDQDRLRKDSEEEIEQLNEVIEKLQQELAKIEQKVPVDFSSTSQDADSLKHQLDMVIAEKEILQQEMDKNNAEVALSKSEVEDTRVKMNLLKEELDTLKKKLESLTKGREYVDTKNDNVVKGERKKTELLEETLRDKTAQFLTQEILLRSMEENTHDNISSLEMKLQELQAVTKHKDIELSQCYSQIETMKEQVQAEREVHEQKLLEMEDSLREKVAAALVSQVQLKAVQEQIKVRLLMETATTDNEEATRLRQAKNTTHKIDELTESKLSVLTIKVLELEHKLDELHKQLEFEKEQVCIAQKETMDKEKKLSELQHVLQQLKDRHLEKEVAEKLKKEKMDMFKVVAEPNYDKEENGYIAELELELEKIKLEAATAKEELNSYREKAEKLEQQLSVKEASIVQLQEELYHVKENLTQADLKLALLITQEEQVKKLGNQTTVNEPNSAASKEKAHLISRNSSSQTDKVMNINNSNQAPPLVIKDAEIQTDLPFFQNGYSSEEITEVINQYTEKFEQMQELHAAEIMDMETRHITESEVLKREQLVAVQALTEECDALKAMIESLTAKGVIIPGPAQTPSYQIRDGYPSDTSSDWSQGTYSVHSQMFDTASEDSKEEAKMSVDLLPNKIKRLLNAVHQEGIQVLSLTELPSAERDVQSATSASHFWLEERKVFLGAIASLKDVIAKMQVQPQEEESPESSIHIQDWRGELLHAIQEVFLKEANVLRAAFHTQLAALGTTEAAILVSQLEDRLKEQGIEHAAAMDCIQGADRRSLLLEIQALRSEINWLKMEEKMKPHVDSKSQEQSAHVMLQEQSPLLVELNSVKGRVAELQDQLNSEKMLVAELTNELAQAKLELGTTLKAQHKHFKELETLRLEVAEKASEVDRLNDTLANEQKRMRELHWALEKEKAKMERMEEREKEELEDLRFSLEDQNLKNLQLSKLLEQEKQLVSELQQKMESQKGLHESQLSQEQGQNSEFKVLLEAEKIRAFELATALEREKELRVQLKIHEGSGEGEMQKPQEELLKDLQSQLDEKHNRIVELIGETERYKLECVQMRQKLEEDEKIQKRALQAEQEANNQATRKVQQLASEVKDLQGQVEEKIRHVQKLQQEEKLLQVKIQDLQHKKRDREEKQEPETTRQDLQETTWDSSCDRTRNWVFQQKTEGEETKQSSNSPQLNGVDIVTGSNQALESIKQRLQKVSSKLKHLATKAASRVPFEAADDGDFVWSLNTIQDVLSQLKQLPGLYLLGESSLPPKGSCSSLTERLLYQNAELTGYVSRLTEEKNDLRNALIKLEEELRVYKQRGPSGDHVCRHSLDNEVNVDALLASEREISSKEKHALQKSLKLAEAELSKLKADLRNDSFLRDLGPDSENLALKRIYGKYLRSESYRKALIYQKKYLLLLLGGFQECEQATLSLIARMGGQPCYTDLEIITNHSRAFTRFRSAVRVSIAISRMKFLVRRWQRAIGASSITSNRNDFGQSSGNEVRAGSPYFPPGGLDLYGEQRLSSSRSRSDLESPRSTVTSQHRYQVIPADLSPCSHLQNYDPDRALTDYINRLESLQRRLGSAQSGSTTSTQLHYGTRR